MREYKYEWFKNEKMKDLDFEIGILLNEIIILRDLFEDLREVITCKPTQQQYLIKELEKQTEMIYSRIMYFLKDLKKEINGGE